MIRNSFIFLDKIGYKREQIIWQQDIDNWNDFLNKKVKGISALRKSYYNRQIKKAKDNLWNDNSEYFSKKLSFAEHWRLYNYFKDDAIFLDIETSGYYGDITIVGMYNGYETKTMVKGFNLDKKLLEKELSKYKVLVTFNGASFDMPVIKRYFNIALNIPHIDLRFVCSRIGLKGGLKKIEKDLNIKRAPELRDISGEDAVYLWNMWLTTRNKKYLDLLVQYNEEDIVNLKPIADFAVKELWKKTRLKL